jgi:hypothetical protein
MPGKRSTILRRLPVAVRRQLETRLTNKSSESYQELSQWLADQGYQISNYSISRYDRKFEREVEKVTAASEQARARAELCRGGDGQMTQVLGQMVQQRLFNILLECSGPIKTTDLARFAKAIGDLGRAAISRRHWSDQIRDRLEQQQRAAAKRVEQMEHAGGLSTAAARILRDTLLGINLFTLGEQASPPAPAADPHAVSAID